MASITFRQERNTFYVRFYFNNKPYFVACAAQTKLQAQKCKQQVEKNLQLLKEGYLQLPNNCQDIGNWILTGGKKFKEEKEQESITLHQLLDKYFEQLPDNALSDKTLKSRMNTCKVVKQLIADIPCKEITKTTWQNFIETRSKTIIKKTKKPICADTIKKQIRNMSAIWNSQKELIGKWQHDNLQYPKQTAIPMFCTWEEIEDKIAGGEDEQLWKCLFLRKEEVSELLQYVKENGPSWLYYMVLLATASGMRRSELCNTMISDINFNKQQIDAREFKRNKAYTNTFRKIPLAKSVCEELKHFIGNRKGLLFAVSPDDATMTLRRCLRGSKWEVVRGWHILRHSYCSILAASGKIHPTFIQKWMGHTNTKMHQRYLHLYPETSQELIESIWN